MEALPTLTRDERIGGGLFILVAAVVVSSFGQHALDLYTLLLSMYIVTLGLGYGFVRIYGRTLSIRDGLVIAGIVLGATFFLQLVFTYVRTVLHTHLTVTAGLDEISYSFALPLQVAITIQVVFPGVWSFVIGLADTTRQELLLSGALPIAFVLSLLGSVVLQEGGGLSLTAFVEPTVIFAGAILFGIPLYIGASHLSQPSSFEAQSQLS